MRTSGSSQGSNAAQRKLFSALFALLALSACIGDISSSEAPLSTSQTLEDTDVTVTFEEFNGGVTLTDYAGIRWGSAAGGWVTWYDGYEPLPLTMTAYVNNEAKTEVTETFTLPAGQVLKSLKAASFEGAPATVKVSSPGNPERVWTGIGSSYQALSTGWTTAASVVTVKVTCGSTYGAADVIFDDLVYGPVDDALPPEPDSTDGVVWEPISIAETRSLRDSFSWSNTTALSEAPVYEYAVDGEVLQLPAVHYGLIYVRSPDELRELEELGVHYAMAPFFDEEWPEDDTQHLILPFEGDIEDDGGSFVFALIPSVVYNALRAESLAGEETYRAVILRDVPAEANAGDNTVSWPYLLESMDSWAPLTTEFNENGEEVVPPLVDEEVSGLSDKRLGRRLRQVLRRVIQVTRGTVDLIRRGIGAAARLVSRDSVIEIETSLRSRTKAPLIRAWDDGEDPFDPNSPRGFGKPLTLKGLRVNVSGRSGLTLYKHRLNELGKVNVSVPRAFKVRICFEADSPAAKFEAGFLRPVLHCWPKFRPSGERQRVAREVGDTEFYTMAQLIDARQYAWQALSHDVPQAVVQTGKLAEWMTAGDAGDAYVPCLAATKGPVSVVNAYADVLNAAGGIAGTPGTGLLAATFVEFLFTTDIIMSEDTRRSRNTPVHEYGHFVFCTLLADTRMQTFNTVWSQVLWLPNLNGDATTPVKALNEGFADWFSSQVAGSVNYFHPPGSARELPPAGDPPTSRGHAFIDSSAPGKGEGLEANYGGPACSQPGCFDTSGANAQDRVVATVATILHDALDRGPCGNEANCRDMVRNDAAVWITNTDGTLSPFTLEQPFTLSHVSDEEIALTGADIAQAIREFADMNGAAGAALSYDNFYTALRSIMRQNGYTEPQICKLFALHTANGVCEGWPDGSVQRFNVSFHARLVPADSSGTLVFGRAEADVQPDDDTIECTDWSCTVPRGRTLNLRAVAESGFRFTHWSGCSEATTPDLPLQNITSDHACVANFELATELVFSVTTNNNGSGTSTASAPYARRGESVTLTATPNAGHQFTSWSGSPECMGTNPTLVISNVTSNVACVANFTPIAFTVTGVPNVAAGGSVTPATSTVNQGGNVTLTATPSTGYRFAVWGGSPECTGSNPQLAISNVTRDVACVATFTRITFTVTGSVSGGTGGSVTPATTTVNHGGGVTLTATPSTGYRFVSWGGSAQCTGTNPTLVISNVTSNVACVATFSTLTYTVRANVSGGVGGTVSPTTTSVNRGGSVTLSATATTGYRFASWSGSAQCTGTSTTLVISPVNSDVTCTASFVALSYTVRASANTGGTVSPTSVTVSYNGSATLRATASSGYRFTGWSGSAQCTGTSTTLTISPVRSDVTCAASFARNNVTVSFWVTPSGAGTIATSGAPFGSCGSSSCSFAPGSSVTLTARANAGYVFTGWSGCSSQSEAALTLSNVTASQSCTASFIRTYRVTYSAESPAIATAGVRFGPECSGGVCTVIEGGGVDLSAYIEQWGAQVDDWTCTEAGTGRVLTSAGDPYPEYFSLISIYNNWSCIANTSYTPW